MNPRYPLVADRAGHRCEYCHAPEAVFNFPFEVEHIVPPCSGGMNNDSNLALACRSCNIYKSDHVEVYDPESRGRVLLFNPREDNWHEHFQADVETGAVIGLTPTGRGTVLQLRINSDVQCAARIQWQRLGLYP